MIGWVKRSVAVAGLCIFLSTILNAQNIPSDIVRAFSPFTVSAGLRHRLERLEVKDKILNIDLWYEDSSVTKTGEPSDSLFCKIAHTLIYGRHLDRSKKSQLPIEEAFSKLSDITAVKLNFFTVYMTNKPFSPTWDKKPTESQTPSASKLRVVWAREETVIPYLSYQVTRGEWSTLNKLVKTKGQINFEDFQDQLCGSVLKFSPGLRANYKEIQAALAKQRSGSSR